MDRNNGDARIVYLGTPAMSAVVLRHLVEKGFNIVGVVSQPDAPKGRDRRPSPSPVSAAALELGIPLHRPERLNRDYSFIEDLKPDLLLTFAFGQILSSKVLALSSSYAPLNIHASDLPLLRGASPIQTALIQGLDSTAVCLMEMVREMDAGRVFARVPVAIAPQDNCTTLSDKVVQASVELVDKYLPEYLEHWLEGVAQDPEKVTFCTVFKARDEYLDPGLTPEEFIGRVRGFALTPGAFLELESGLRIKVFEAHPSDVRGEEGRILEASGDRIILGVRGGSVNLTSVQKPGKRAMSARDFNNGTRDLKGQRVLPVDEVFEESRD